MVSSEIWGKYADLPGYLRRYIRRFAWSEQRIEEWLRQPVTALANRSILQALADGDLDSVNNVVLHVGDVLGIDGNFC